MGLSVSQSNNATAEVAAAVWPLIRIATVKGAWGAKTPQNNTGFSTPWTAVDKNVGGFSGLCYYFGRNMFLGLGGKTPVGLVEQAVGGTYIESFMPPTSMAQCNTTGTMPAGWKGAPPRKAGGAPYDPWGAQNQPAALWNSMISPLLTLTFKLAIFDQAEHNLATREAAKFRCLQDKMVEAWRTAMHNPDLSYHLVQLPSYNMSEYTWIYIDPLGEMRLSQSDADLDLNGTTTTVTIDLADIHSPFGSVHNRQKQEVGRRVALNALSSTYGLKLNTGPTFEAAARLPDSSNRIVLTIATGATGAGQYNGSHDCVQCCTQSSFEGTADGETWLRLTPKGAPVVGKRGTGTVELTLGHRALSGMKRVRFGYDALVQCPYFDGDGLPLAPFQATLA